MADELAGLLLMNEAMKDDRDDDRLLVLDLLGDRPLRLDHGAQLWRHDELAALARLGGVHVERITPALKSTRAQGAIRCTARLLKPHRSLRVLVAVLLRRIERPAELDAPGHIEEESASLTRWLWPVVQFRVSLPHMTPARSAKVGRMNRKLIAGAAVLVRSGCGTSANGPLTWKNANGPILT